MNRAKKFSLAGACAALSVVAISLAPSGANATPSSPHASHKSPNYHSRIAASLDSTGSIKDDATATSVVDDVTAIIKANGLDVSQLGVGLMPTGIEVVLPDTFTPEQVAVVKDALSATPGAEVSTRSFKKTGMYGEFSPYYGDNYTIGPDGVACTAGIPIKLTNGQIGFLTAGHCAYQFAPSQANKVYTISAGGSKVSYLGWEGNSSYPTGSLTSSYVNNSNGGDYIGDQRMIAVSSGQQVRGAIYTSKTSSSRIVSSWASAAVGTNLCFTGAMTGAEACGQILKDKAFSFTDADGTHKWLALTQWNGSGTIGTSVDGDSGSAVYFVKSDGTVIVVGTEDYDVAGCVPAQGTNHCGILFSEFSRANARWGILPITGGAYMTAP